MNDFPTLPDDIAVLLVDFDETLTKNHTGGALQFRRSAPFALVNESNESDDNGDANRDAEPRRWKRVDLHRNITNNGDQSLVQNAASNDIAWSFRLLQDVVLRQRRCLAIVTMADNAHGVTRAAQTQLDPALYETLAGESLVRRWLLCAALVACNNDYECARRQLLELEQSKRFTVVAMAHPCSKAQHVRVACQRFFDNKTLDATRLQARHMLYLDNTACLLAATAASYPGMRTIHTPRGVDRAVWRHVCATSQFIL